MRAFRSVVAVASLLLAGPLVAVHAAPAPQAKLMAEKASLSPGGYVPSPLSSTRVLSEVEPNDTPAAANALTVSNAIECALTAGDTDWFAVTATPGAFLTLSTAELLEPITDTLLLVYASDGVTPLGADDDSGAGLFSAIEHFACPATGGFYVEIRHFSPTGRGSYQLVVEPGSAAPLPPANDTCAAPIDVQCNGVVTGSTSSAIGDVSAEVTCAGYAPNGPDVFYRVQVPYSYQLRVQVSTLTSFDPAVYLFTSCGEGISCLAGADAGFVDEDELVTWVNELEGPPQFVYVGVDSWSSTSRGDFRLAVSCEFVVPNQQTSWGTLKSSFGR